MNKKLLLSILICSSLPSFCFSAEGAISGGGGRGVVCRDSSGVITSAETLDLYEGRVMYGLDVPKTNEPMDLQVERAVQKFQTNKAFGFLRFKIDMVKKSFKFTPKDVDLVPVDDSFEVIAPRNCKIEQLANYYNDSLIMVNGDIWAKLSETDKAALILHESVYYMERMYKAQDSRRARKLVVYSMLDSTQWENTGEGVPADALKCFSNSGNTPFFFFAYKDGEVWNLSFQALGAGIKVSKATTFVEAKIFDLNKTMVVEPGDDHIGEVYSSAQSVRSKFESNDFIVITKKWETLKDSSTGEVIRGYQMPRYYLSWKSSDFPGKVSEEVLINCTLKSDYIKPVQ